MQTPSAPAPAPLTVNHTFIAAIRRKLDRWELTHLRLIAQQQADKIELLECNLTREAERANYWQDECRSIIAQLQESGQQIGLAMDGEILVGAA